MKLLALPRLVIGTAIACLCATPALAQFQITIAPGTAGSMTITDGGANDIDPAADGIGVEQEVNLGGGVKFLVSGHAVQKIVAGTRADVRFDRLTIANTGTAAAAQRVDVQSAAFAAIGPPFVATLHLDGKFTHFKAEPIINASVTWKGFVNPGLAAVGTITPPAAVGVAPPVAFGPPASPDQTKTFAFGVTGLVGQLSFNLGPGDRAVLPGSATLSGYTADRIISVNSLGDAPDRLPGDGVCDIIGFPGVCTLRAALTEADQEDVVTAIHFNIPVAGVPRIQIQADTSFNGGSLGALRPVIVDGTSQPGGLVELSGSAASPVDAGGNPIVALDLVGADSVVRGLVINGFPSHGVQIRPTGAPFGGNNVVEGNFIGVDATGAVAVPNAGDGVRILEMPGNSILANVIATNAGNGVSVDGAAATGNRIHANAIRANGELGIALLDNGNNLQAAPVLTAALSDGDTLTVQGTVTGAPNATFVVDVFDSTTCDPSGAGEGERFLGSAVATTSGAGSASFVALLPDSAAIVTSTATDHDGNTSQFSGCVTVAAVPSVVAFAAFDPKVRIKFGRRGRSDEFDVRATFTLGPGSDGVQLLSEPVTLELGTFSTTIPAGSFHDDKRGGFTFQGTLDGVRLDVSLRQRRQGGFDLRAAGGDVDLTGTTDPVPVTLVIGDDGGTATVAPKVPGGAR